MKHPPDHRPADSGAARKLVRDAMRRLGSDQLEHRIEVEADDPLAELADELNAMAERLQRRREEVVRAVELYCLRRFGSVLVHDLKNLAARLSFVPDNLRNGADEPQVVEACATTVEDTAGRIQALVRRFRDQREAMVLRTNGDIVRTLRSALKSSGVPSIEGIQLELSLEPLPEAAIDAPYLEEALVNILRNAAEAMDDHGRLEVGTRLIHGVDGRPIAEIRVADQGPGMTAQFVERELFEPFRSTKPNGMGLGMFSCRETVELHGGRIVIDSSPGAGTTVCLSIPIEPEKGPPA